MTPSQPLLRADEAPAARTLVDVFAESVAAFPDATALDSGQERLTYAELAEAADELADELAARGVGRGDRVGVRLPSGTTDLYVAILGILHAGAAYVPVDASTGTQAIYSYYNEVSKDHFLTTNFNSLGSGGKYGWSYHGVEALTFKAQYTGTVPLLRYYSKSVRDHVYLTDPTVLGTEKAKADGWAFQGVEGYVFPAKDE